VPGQVEIRSAQGPQLQPVIVGVAIPVDAQIRVLEARRDELRAEMAELERRADNLNLPIPLPKDALQKGVTRGMFSLEYGVRRYRFEIDWIENLLAVLGDSP